MKFLIGLLAAILFTGIASAQHSDSPVGHVNIGIKGGLNVSNIHADDGSEYDYRIGYHFGLLGHIHLGNHFAIQPEILFSSQGAKYTFENETTNYNLDYINVPVLFQYMFNGGFRIEAGPQVGFLARAKYINNSGTSDEKDYIEPIDWALCFGMSYVHPSSGFGVDARFNMGLSNIDKNTSVVSTNRGFQAGVFYIFGYNSIVKHY
jgi:hypothetical protein